MKQIGFDFLKIRISLSEDTKILFTDNAKTSRLRSLHSYSANKTTEIQGYLSSI